MQLEEFSWYIIQDLQLVCAYVGTGYCISLVFVVTVTLVTKSPYISHPTSLPHHDGLETCVVYINLVLLLRGVNMNVAACSFPSHSKCRAAAYELVDESYVITSLSVSA